VKKILFTASLIMLIAIFSAVESSARGRKPRRLAPGEWGGQHIRMNVGESSATIEYDCAHGQMNGPLVIDRRGRFDLKGTHSREHGGPIRQGESESSQPARYTGWTDGKRMTLTVTLTGARENIGTFNLTLGGSGRIFKCR